LEAITESTNCKFFSVFFVYLLTYYTEHFYQYYQLINNYNNNNKNLSSIKRELYQTQTVKAWNITKKRGNVVLIGSSLAAS